jgi:DNA-binding response OmpR family regulator
MSIKILVIDDDVTLTDMVRVLLEANEYQVYTANSGTDGIEAARESQPDLVVLDLMMPDLDGWQVCRAIRSFSQVPILVLSAVIDTEGVMRALEEGADEYLIKPVPVGVLVANVRQMAQYKRGDQQKTETNEDP